MSAMHAVRQAHTTCHAVLLAFSAAVQQDVHRLLTDGAHDPLAQADRTPPVKVIAMTHGGESHALETSELAQQIDKYCKKNQLNLRWGCLRFAEKCRRQGENGGVALRFGSLVGKVQLGSRGGGEALKRTLEALREWFCASTTADEPTPRSRCARPPYCCRDAVRKGTVLRRPTTLRTGRERLAILSLKPSLKTPSTWLCCPQAASYMPVRCAVQSFFTCQLQGVCTPPACPAPCHLTSPPSPESPCAPPGCTTTRAMATTRMRWHATWPPHTTGGTRSGTPWVSRGLLLGRWAGLGCGRMYSRTGCEPIGHPMVRG